MHPCAPMQLQELEDELAHVSVSRSTNLALRTRRKRGTRQLEGQQGRGAGPKPLQLVGQHGRVTGPLQLDRQQGGREPGPEKASGGLTGLGAGGLDGWSQSRAGEAGEEVLGGTGPREGGESGSRGPSFEGAAGKEAGEGVGLHVARPGSLTAIQMSVSHGFDSGPVATGQTKGGGWRRREGGRGTRGEGDRQLAVREQLLQVRGPPCWVLYMVSNNCTSVRLM